MCPEDLYVIPDEAADGSDDEEWIQPRSVEEIVVERIDEVTDYDPDDLGPLGEYVDHDAVVSLFADDDGPDELSFAVEDVEVTIHRSGAVTVDDE